MEEARRRNAGLNLNGLLKHRSVTVERLEKFIQSGQFEDVNLRSFLWKHKSTSAVTLQSKAIPDLRRVSFTEGTSGAFVPTKIGESFGPSWATHWFKLQCTIPNEWKGEEVILNFDPDCEGMVWSTTGVPLQGLTGTTGTERHIDFRLTKSAKGGEIIDLFIEIACNGLFGNGNGIEAPDANKSFKLKTAELAVPNNQAFQLLWDFEVLIGMVKELSTETQINADALYVANQAVNVLRRNDVTSVSHARAITQEFFCHTKEGGICFTSDNCNRQLSHRHCLALAL